MFNIGDKVYKQGAYTGPGIVRGIIAAGVNSRYIVGHTIQGGQGEFLHVYSESNLTALLPAKKTQEQSEAPA